MSTCKHEWRFLYVVHWLADNIDPVTGRKTRHYADRFHCVHCLSLELRNTRALGHSEMTPVMNTWPSN